jgi:hypothetical protein
MDGMDGILQLGMLISLLSFLMPVLLLRKLERGGGVVVVWWKS